MRRQNGLGWIAAVMVVFSFAGCGDDDSPTSSGGDGDNGGGGGGDSVATFTMVQDSVLTPRCVNQSCHPGGGGPMSMLEGEAYANLVDVRSGGWNMLRVAPGEPDSSLLYQKVLGSASTGSRMPLGRPALTDSELQMIRTWIVDGAKDN